MSPRRPLFLTVVATAAVAVSGCGGDDAADSAKEAQAKYAGAVDTFCGEILQSGETIQKDVQEAVKGAGTDQQAAFKALGDVLATFSGSINDSVERLDKAEVPEDYKAFHDGAVSGISRMVGVLDQAAAGVRKGELKALDDIGGTIDNIKVPDPPAELAESAPNCDKLGEQ